MNKIFKNVVPQRFTGVEINKEDLQQSLADRQILVPNGYDWSGEYEQLVLQQAIYLNNLLDRYGQSVTIGLVYSPNTLYPGWNLLLDTTHVKGSLNLVVSMFYNFTEVENDCIFDFEELICDSWNG